MATLCIKNGRVLDPASGTDKPADVLVDGERIADIVAPGSGKADKVIDASGKWVAPGFIDLHVHLREPGEEYKEDIASGSLAAARGGFTTVLARPNTKPAIDNAELVRHVRQRGIEVGLCRVLPSGAVTVGQAGEVLAPFGEMKAAGAVALTDDGHPVQNAGLMRHALAYAKDFDLPILTHAEEKSLSRGGFMHEGVVSTRLGLRGIPALAEDVAVGRDIQLTEATGSRLHVCHVSTAGAVELIRQAKKRGVRVTGEAAPHHFTLTHEAVAGYDPNTKMSPPLREEHDRLAVIAGLADGTLDCIATDHAPHSVLEKQTTFDEALNGIIGLETALSLVLSVVQQGALSLLVALERLTVGPAKILGLPHGRLQKGAPADVVVIDPEATWEVTREGLASKSKNTPWLGKQLRGRAVATVLGGRQVVG
jgi:dihydroorotase